MDNVIFQAPNNEIEFNLTGDSDCLNFFKILPSGGLYVTSDLTADRAKSTLYLVCIFQHARFTTFTRCVHGILKMYLNILSSCSM